MTADRPAAIMIVDDEEIVTQTLRSLLTLETDFEVHTFTSPQSALEALHHTHVDAIISDFLMPEMNGLEFLAEVKRRHPDVVRILLTGYADRDNAIKAINEVGLFQYVEKPWDNDQLILIIRNGLNTKSLTRRLNQQIDELDKTLRERDRIAAQHDQLREELLLARRMQENMLPQTFPAADGLSFHARYLPALEVGGDFYDVTTLSERRLAAIVADVTGHGVRAALSTSLLKSAFNEFAGRDVGPRDILTGMNAVLHRVLPVDVFVAASVATIDAATGVMEFANGGGPHPFHVQRSAGAVDNIVSTGLLLGVVEPEVYQAGEAVSVQLAPGDGVMIFTDGLTEIENQAGEEFGVTQMYQRLVEMHDQPADTISERIITAARDFSQENHDWDDVTILTLERSS